MGRGSEREYVLRDLFRRGLEGEIRRDQRFIQGFSSRRGLERYSKCLEIYLG